MPKQDKDKTIKLLEAQRDVLVDLIDTSRVTTIPVDKLIEPLRHLWENEEEWDD